MIKKKQLGSTDIFVPEISLGTWKIGIKNDISEIRSLIIYAYSMGINFVDTAPVYCNGSIEAILGKLKPEFPDLLVSTKIPGIVKPAKGINLSHVYPKGYLEDKTASILKSSGLDCIDLLQLHNWSSEWNDSEIDQLFNELFLLKQKGYTRSVGISTPKRMNFLDKRLVYPGIDFLQAPINLYKKWAAHELIPACKEKNIGVLARTVLAEGYLNFESELVMTDLVAKEKVEYLCHILSISEKDLPLYAIRFSRDMEGVSSTIIGMNSRESINSTIKSLELPIDYNIFKKISTFEWDYDEK